MDAKTQKNPQTSRSRSFTLFFRPREAMSSLGLFVCGERKWWQLIINVFFVSKKQIGSFIIQNIIHFQIGIQLRILRSVALNVGMKEPQGECFSNLVEGWNLFQNIFLKILESGKENKSEGIYQIRVTKLITWLIKPGARCYGTFIILIYQQRGG